MYNAEVITPAHRTRKAIIYIRQSTPHQALSHQESLRLQYALTERARGIAWAQILEPACRQVIDAIRRGTPAVDLRARATTQRGVTGSAASAIARE